MAKLAAGDLFPSVTLNDIDGVTVEFPVIFKQATGPANTLVRTRRSIAVDRRELRHG